MFPLWFLALIDVLADGWKLRYGYILKNSGQGTNHDYCWNLRVMDCSNPAITKAMSEGVRLHTVPRMPRILLAACGCIDALKFRLLCQEFSGWAKISVVFTKSSLRFIDTESLFPKGLNVYRSNSANELLQWADIMVIAPLSAHTLAKVIKPLKLCRFWLFLSTLSYDW